MSSNADYYLAGGINYHYLLSLVTMHQVSRQSIPGNSHKIDMLDVFVHTNNLLAIENSVSEFDIRENMFDQLFENTGSQASHILFYGFHRNVYPDVIENELKYLTDTFYLKVKGNLLVLCEVNRSELFLNRNRLGSFWEYYTHPAFIFVLESRENILPKIVDQVRNRIGFEEIVATNNSTFIIYQGITDNVIWMLKSDNLMEAGTSAFEIGRRSMPGLPKLNFLVSESRAL